MGKGGDTDEHKQFNMGIVILQPYLKNFDSRKNKVREGLSLETILLIVYSGIFREKLSGKSIFGDVHDIFFTEE